MVTAETTIVMTMEEAEIFYLMKQKGVFNIQYGKATLNFAGGILQNIIREEMIYNAKFA